MKKYAIVCCSGWLDWFCHPPFHHLATAPSEIFDIFIVNYLDDIENQNITSPLNWKDMRDIIINKYDAVVCCEDSFKLLPDFKGLKIVIKNDLHSFSYRKTHHDLATLAWADFIFSSYSLCSDWSRLYPISIPYKLIKEKFCLFPHVVEEIPEYKPIQFRENNISVEGNRDEFFYPIRKCLYELFTNNNFIDSKDDKITSVGVDYLKKLSNIKIAVTCNAELHYTVGKYVEIPAAGCLLFAPRPHTDIELACLGFNEENSLLYPQEYFMDQNFVLTKVREIINDEDKMNHLSVNSHKLATKRFTKKVRYYQLYDIISKLLSGCLINNTCVNYYFANYNYDLFSYTTTSQ